MLEIKSLRHPTGCSLIVKALLCASVLASAGCAQLPRMDPPPAMKKVEQLEYRGLLRRAGCGLAGGPVVAGVRGSAAQWPHR